MARVAALGQFGRLLRRRRLEAGLSQESLAARAGLDRTYISGIERGERNVSLINLCKLGEALGVGPEELVKGVRFRRPTRGRSDTAG